MPESPTISSAVPENRGLDYAWLKQEGTHLIQQLAGDIWTDYNEHDPGVTTLEQLCYALTDLSYRAELPLADLLLDPRSGRIDTRRQALFVPRRILPCNPVTANDYRKLLVDRVAGVANAWLVPRPAKKGIAGLYDILLYAPGADPCACDEDFAPAAVVERAKRVYCRHRDLCEDVHEIVILTPVVTQVGAIVTIDDSRTPEAVLAALLFNVGNFLAPELRRQPLEALVAAGTTTDAIFEGPLLRNGFIADDQLKPKAAAVAVSSIVRVMARTAGVIGLRKVSVRTGETSHDGEAVIPVPAKDVLQLDPRPGPDGFSIRLWRKGVEIRPDPARVKREFDRLWSEERRTYPLTQQYQRYFAVPEGHRHDLAAYYSVQNQFPNAYGINLYGVPDEAGSARKAQAKQLKGYLLAFEQLLADFFAQLAHVRELYSSASDLPHTYFYQSLAESVPNVASLLRPDYRHGLARIVESQDAVVDRRNRFLAVLLALYGETLDQSMVAGADTAGGDGGPYLLHARLALLRHLVSSTRYRGRGFDYLAAGRPRNVAGMLIKSRIQLGMEPFDIRPRSDILAEFAIELVDSEDAASIGRPLSGHTDHIEDSFVALETTEPPAAGGVSPLRGQRVTEEFLQAAGEIGNVRVGSLPGESDVVVVLKSRNGSQWRFVGRYADREAAQIVVVLLVEHAGRLGRHARRLFIVEHTLLRFGRDHPHDEDDGEVPEREYADEGRAPFVYDFTITAVLTAPHHRDDGEDGRIFARQVIRANTPAHIAIDYCFLHSRHMHRFEHRYAAWREALRRQDHHEMAHTAARLRRFLQRHAERPHADTTADAGPPQ